MVFELLVLGTFVTHKSATRHHQVGASCIKRLIHEEVFLFPAEIRENVLNGRVEVLSNRCTSLVHAVEGTEKRSLIVERFTSVGNEDGGDTQGVVDDESRRRNIPSRISASLEGVTDTAIREA